MPIRDCPGTGVAERHGQRRRTIRRRSREARHRGHDSRANQQIRGAAAIAIKLHGIGKAAQRHRRKLHRHIRPAVAR